MNTVKSADGTPIAYSVSGAGPALLLVHGATADQSRWTSVVPGLAEHLTVYTMDRRGHGQSGDTVDYALEREFEDVAAVVDAIGSPVFLLGHSYGAICALEAALLTPNIARLILYEPPIQMPSPPGVAAKIHRLLDEGRKEDALLTFLLEAVRAPRKDVEASRSHPVWPVRVASAGTLAREITALEEYTLQPERFRSMTTPTLLLLGGESVPDFVKATERVHAALPASRIERLPGQRHSAMNTAPDLFIERVLNFLIGINGESMGSDSIDFNPASKTDNAANPRASTTRRRRGGPGFLWPRWHPGRRR